MAKKVNINAITAAIIAQKRYYAKTSCSRYESIIYIEPRVLMFNVKEIIGISLRLTGQWDKVTITGPGVVDPNCVPRLIVFVDDLLPEFIVEGE